jgi:gamma-glutamyltranspeptidase/glutathione hydrolase
MSPIIIFDKNDDFFLTLGSPGGKAIISYVFKCLIAVLYMNESIEKAIEKPNYIKIKGNIFVEDDILNNELSTKGLKRNLTSGIVIIKKNDDGYIAAADSRRDGTVRGN